MSGTTLGVVVPCRDEAAVVERKLADLARVRWPAAPRPHRVVVVDDGSRDGTAELARAAIERGFARRHDLRAEVLATSGAPGKAHAIARGVAALGRDVDLVVLTDADVTFESGALVELAAAFEREPRLGLACGAQRFVRELACGDGEVDPAGVEEAGGVYDRWTAAVRRLESQSGRLFSVHGQLLAWRRELGLAPTPGIAADDIDLRMQARAAGARVELIRAARFLEAKAPAGEPRRAQELRRARAFVQCVGAPHVRELAARAGALDRLHLACYRRLPLAAPWLAAAALVAAPLGAWALGAPRAALAWLAAAALAAASSPGRRLARLLLVIARASLAERREPLSGEWRTARR